VFPLTYICDCSIILTFAVLSVKKQYSRKLKELLPFKRILFASSASQSPTCWTRPRGMDPSGYICRQTDFTTFFDHPPPPSSAHHPCGHPHLQAGKKELFPTRTRPQTNLSRGCDFVSSTRTRYAVFSASVRRIGLFRPTTHRDFRWDIKGDIDSCRTQCF
jgi:hypothetical protein